MSSGDVDQTIIRTEASISESSSGSEPEVRAGDEPRAVTEFSVLKSRFVLEEKLGSGGMGVVYKARDLRKVEARDRFPYVAVKVLNDDFRTHPEAFIALQREASKSQTISHPNIVSIFDFDKDGEVPFITMELLEGRELADLLRSYPNGLPDAMAWEVISGMCQGLAHAHGANVIHADLKPGNIYVSSSNRAKILDFGIARAVQINQQQGEDTVFDPARLAALTPAYASREMLNGDNPEPRDDLYSLGVVVYLILTGHHPFGRLSAIEASAEGLKPERPKGLSFRQWRGLKRALAFNRQDRPGSVEDLVRLLLKPAPWRTGSALAAAAAVVVALSAGLAIDGQEISEVKEEVRQTTLLDAQLNRLQTLMEEPAFDPNWERLLWAETETLMALDNTGSWVAQHQASVRELYDTEIRRSGNIRRSMALLERARRYGDMRATEQALGDQVVQTIQKALDENSADPAWLNTLTSSVRLLEQNFASQVQLAELKLQIADAVEVKLQEALAASDLDQARALYAQLETLRFDAPTLEAYTEALTLTQKQTSQQQRVELAVAATDTLVSDLDELFTSSCLRLDMNAISRRFESAQDARQVRDAGRRRLGEGFSKCIDRLSAIDPDRAVALHDDVLKRFGRLPGVPRVAVDPCGMRYLVGNGSNYGRGSYCADQLTDQEGPRLVVVPNSATGSRFAITRKEITWGEYNTYCRASGRCQPSGQSALPVRGISLQEAQGYIAWLSSETGYTYRLPTEQEWQIAASGPADPNRNCRISINGIERGLTPVAADMGKSNPYGLIHVLGNVQEWVLAGEGLKASGGAYSDPIQKCIAATTRSHDGGADVTTGFRLVREVS
jgi:tRNA A-37 threonylcarbamoyl transferase component Bud32